jgi:hypothetical protein
MHALLFLHPYFHKNDRSFKSGFLGSAVSYGASWSGAYEAAGVSSQANTWAQRAQNAVASYVVGGIAAENQIHQKHLKTNCHYPQYFHSLYCLSLKSYHNHFHDNDPYTHMLAKPTHGHKEYKMLSPLMWLVGLLLSWVAVSLLMAG